MKKLSTDEIRQLYLDFFQSKDHTVIPGAPLIPENDPTVLFTTAGMHPLVPYLLGEPHPAGKRVVDVQRCIRTGDIDEVGDAGHLTFFEMLGNWSFGDYFKKEAIEMSFEFLTEVLEIPKEKLAVSCFEGDADAPKDEEAAKYWKKVGLPEDRIAFLDKKENWWGPAGLTGPCGPDTEMFYWIGKGEPHGNPGENPDDWLEIWNDVFMQYEKRFVEGSSVTGATSTGSCGSETAAAGEAGEREMEFVPLKQKNVDTGMGLERTAAVMQGVSNVYEIDSMKPIMDRVVSLATPEDAQHQRIVVDHLKAATFLIADGVQPGNVDQPYVLRKIIRRAIRSAKQLGIETDGSFSPQISDIVVELFHHTYGYLKEKEKEIADVLAREEQQFNKTLQEGLKQFEKVVSSLSGKEIDGQSAFHLYDTYGFPMELTKEMAGERGLTVDEAGFTKAFEEHQEKSRAGAEQKFSGGLADQSGETTKLHTATHLLNEALRRVLGEHVQQKGSNITAERLRFDFNNPEKVTKEQLAEVEQIVNQAIKDDLPVSYHLTTVDGAKEEGAIGVFDERYGEEVKVYVVDGFSREICGGPHVARTGMIGQFKIKKEESSSAGIRRIKATVSGGPEDIEVAEEE